MNSLNWYAGSTMVRMRTMFAQLRSIPEPHHGAGTIQVQLPDSTSN
ncbi:hypothetical protein [Noviherbaspirillum aerium]|nr:hypothetical protein [Noviherbaspirillum aerium]